MFRRRDHHNVDRLNGAQKLPKNKNHSFQRVPNSPIL